MSSRSRSQPWFRLGSAGGWSTEACPADRPDDLSPDIFHVTRAAPDHYGRMAAHGHPTVFCEPTGCPGPETSLGTYDPNVVRCDQESGDVEVANEAGDILIIPPEIWRAPMPVNIIGFIDGLVCADCGTRCQIRIIDFPKTALYCPACSRLRPPTMWGLEWERLHPQPVTPPVEWPQPFVATAVLPIADWTHET